MFRREGKESRLDLGNLLGPLLGPRDTYTAGDTSCCYMEYLHTVMVALTSSSMK